MTGSSFRCQTWHSGWACRSRPRSPGYCGPGGNCPPGLESIADERVLALCWKKPYTAEQRTRVPVISLFRPFCLVKVSRVSAIQVECCVSALQERRNVIDWQAPFDRLVTKRCFTFCHRG